MNYIVMDLEWNQGSASKDTPVPAVPFEIIEIGAVKLNSERVMMDEFSELIKPQLYTTMHYVTGKLVHLKMTELKNERPFQEVIKKFLEWCGPDPIFCTWGPLDLYELQRNMVYYGLGALSDGPLAFYDVQKLYALEYTKDHKRLALENAVDELKINKDIPFHRAFSDAYYTARVFNEIKRDDTLRHYSYDVYTPPKDKEHEPTLFFGEYDKFISRAFDTKDDLLNDKKVRETNCYICNKKTKKFVKSFSPSSKYVLAVGKCETHGFVKIKTRLRRTDDGKYYAVKTRKLISESDARDILARSEKIKNKAPRIKKEG